MTQQLQAFVAVAEEQNFTRAAEQLHISQPAVSQHIQNLERRLDVKLFDRSNKYVRLNRAGQVAYHHAKDILRLYNQMDRLIMDMKNEAIGTLSIGASFTFGEYVLPHIIAEFMARYPKIKPNITIENTSAVVDGVANGKLDIGIIEGRTPSGDVEVQPIATDTMVMVASTRHPLFQQAKVTASQLEQETWIIREKGSGTREITDAVLATYGIRPHAIMEFGSTQIIKEAVEAGLGITLLSRWVIRKEVQWNALVELPLAGPGIHRQFSLVVRKSDFQTKTTQLFRQFLDERSSGLTDFFCQLLPPTLTLRGGSL